MPPDALLSVCDLGAYGPIAAHAYDASDDLDLPRGLLWLAVERRSDVLMKAFSRPPDRANTSTDPFGPTMRCVTVTVSRAKPPDARAAIPPRVCRLSVRTCDGVPLCRQRSLTFQSGWTDAESTCVAARARAARPVRRRRGARTASSTRAAPRTAALDRAVRACARRLLWTSS